MFLFDAKTEKKEASLLCHLTACVSFVLERFFSGENFYLMKSTDKSQCACFPFQVPVLSLALLCDNYLYFQRNLDRYCRKVDIMYVPNNASVVNHLHLVRLKYVNGTFESRSQVYIYLYFRSLTVSSQ